MRFADAFLVTLLVIPVSPWVIAQDLSWRTLLSSDSPFARLAAVDGNEELISIACVKADITDAALRESRVLSQMVANDSVAVLVPEEPTEGASVRLHLEYRRDGATLARTQMGYVDAFGAFYGVGFIDGLMEATSFMFQKSRPNAESREVDITPVFRDEFTAMAEEHCHAGIANAIGLTAGPEARGSLADTVDWTAGSDWSSKGGEFFLLRRWTDNGLLTQLTDGSGQEAATLTALDNAKSASPTDDFLIDAGNRYFFRAGHQTKSTTLASMTQKGDLSVLDTEDSFTRSLREAVALNDGWILSAGALFHLSAEDELSHLSATPASGSFPAHLVSVGERVIYVDRHPQYGLELFATDGTEQGTGLLLDINDHVYGKGRTRDSVPALEHAARIGNRVVFTATDSSIPSNSARANYHLWSTDGTREGTLRLPTDTFYTNFSNFIAFEGRLYVTARPRGNGEDVLYSTDGTAAGTRALASTSSLVKVVGGDPEKVRSFLGEPTRVANRLIVPLLGSPLGRDRGNPIFEITPEGELRLLSETSEGIGDLSGRLRQTGLSAGGLLLFSGIALKDSTTFEGKTTATVIRGVDPNSGDTKILHELRVGESVDWSPTLPRTLPAADAVAFVTRFASGGSRDIIVTDGTVAGTRALAQSPSLPRIAQFAFSNQRIVWLEEHLFFSFDPGQADEMVLFDPASTYESRPGNAVLGTMRLR